MSSGFRVVIPARYGASRLPGKPLRELAGRPMIAHVVDRAIEAGADEVIVACDDVRIAKAVEALPAHAELTRPDHTSGTDRIAEVAERRGWSDDQIIVNLQGDEPCLPGSLVAALAGALAARSSVGMATLATPLRGVAELFDPNVVKVVADEADHAMYFSRAPIPWGRDSFAAGPPSELPENVAFLRHLGLYAYRVGVLTRICRHPPNPLERAESLEQLRALAMGVAIHLTIVDKAPGHGVDTEDDLRGAEEWLAARADGG